MKISKKVRLVILGLLILLIWITRYFPAMGEWYALHIYPYISIVLSSFSSLLNTVHKLKSSSVSNGDENGI